jgi:predicted RNA-binding Zn ribbon-like protein
MDFRHYSDDAAALAADLVNVFLDAEDGQGPVQPEELRAVLAEHDIHREPTEADVPRLHALARRLHDVFLAADTGTAVDLLNELLADSVAVPYISRHSDFPPHLHFSRPGSGLVESVAASTAMGVAVVLCDYGKERLGACAASDCRDVFIDTSRNAQRRYCSHGCSNRSNVAAHRARKREATT